MAEISLKVKSLIEPLKSVSQSTDDERVSIVLTLSNSSHDPVFVFNNEEKLIGLISPTFALFKRHLPHTAKVTSNLAPAPHLNENAKINEVVDQMLDTRFYTLPIFDDEDKLKGIVRAKTIIKRIARSSKYLNQVAKKIKIKKPITIPYDKTVKDAYELLSTKKISRLLVTDREGKLMGVVTRNDLKNAFIKPTSRQRFSKSSGDTGQSMFDVEKIKRSDTPLTNFIRNNVTKTEAQTLPAVIIKRMIASKRNSIILVGRDDKPTGIVSNRDILLAISNVDDEVDVPIIINKPKKASGFTIDEVENKIIEMGRKINKILPLERFEVSFKQGKNGVGKPNLIETTLSAKFYSGDDFVVKYANHRILVSVNEALNRIYKMVRRGKDKKIKY